MDAPPHNTEQPARYMRVAEAAEYLRIKRSTFDRFCRAFNIPTCSHGGHVRIYDRLDLDEAAAQSKRHKHQPAAQPDIADQARTILERPAR